MGQPRTRSRAKGLADEAGKDDWERGKYEYKIPGSASVRVQLLPEASTSYTFLEGAEGRGRNPSESSTLPPDVPGVLDFFSPNNFTAYVRMDCVDVTTCHSTPDITLHAHAPQQLMIGEDQLVLEVDLEVRNDTAYETVLVVAYPPGLHYVRVAWKTHLPDCRPTKKNERGHSTLTCRFTFELYDGDQVTLTFVFSQSPVILLTQSDDLDLTFHLKVSSDSKDLNEADNVLDLTVTKSSRVNLLVDR
nr:uncharacterized protein LOC128684031 [Cherax quadricarinatus]